MMKAILFGSVALASLTLIEEMLKRPIIRRRESKQLRERMSSVRLQQELWRTKHGNNTPLDIYFPPYTTSDHIPNPYPNDTVFF